MIRQLADDGNDLIFTTSFGFMNPTIKVAKQFPNVKFEHATGYQAAPQRRHLQRPLLRGPRASSAPSPGMMTKTGRRRLYRLLPDPRGGDGHQRLHARARRR